MKITKILFCTLATITLAFFASKASAAPAVVVLAKLNISGTATVNQGGNSNNGKTTKLDPTTSKYDVKDIINLLNNSPAFVSYLQFQTGTNYSQIPSGADLALDLYGKNVWVVLKNGTPLIRLAGTAGTNYYAFGAVGFGSISAKYNYDNNARAGSETDQLADFFLSFDDYNSPVTSFFAQGTAELKSKTGKLDNSVQKLNQSLKFEGTGSVHFNSHTGTGSQKATASGNATIPASYWPFYNWSTTPI